MTTRLLASLTLCLLATPLFAQQPPAPPPAPAAPAGPLSAKLDPSGLVHVLSGDVELATIELNAHGPAWAHAPQTSATARASALPGGGQRFTGTLPIPTTPPTAGALNYVESITPLPAGFKLEYEVGVTQTLKLNGLQVSVNLPVARWGGQTLTITRPDDDDPSVVALLAEARPDVVGLWSGAGSKLVLGAGTDQALTFELVASADITVQDLRKWEQPLYEIRFPALLEDGGREVTPDDRFHLLLTVTCAGPVKLLGP